MNKIKLKLSPSDLNVNIPINLDFSMHGKENLIEKYEDEIVDKIINPINDFEITRFSHDRWDTVESTENYHTNYEFYFYDRTKDMEDTNSGDDFRYVLDYNFSDNELFSGDSFNYREIALFSNSFRKSFFKIDLYDTNQVETQKLYLTIIIPTQQGKTKIENIGSQAVINEVDVRIPSFKLDFIGDKEGYFIYWLKEREYLDITTFYASAKFFNAKNGQFIRMINQPQTSLPKKFNFIKNEKHYYRVELNYDNFTYKFYNVNSNVRVGVETPIRWYEYINK